MKVGIDINLNVGDIRHLKSTSVIRYWRQICWTEKGHSDIGSVAISTSEFILISDVKEKNYSTRWIQTHPP